MPLFGRLDLDTVGWKDFYIHEFTPFQPRSKNLDSNMKMKARDWDIFKSVFIVSSVYHPADTFNFFPLDLVTVYSAFWVKRS